MVDEIIILTPRSLPQTAKQFHIYLVSEWLMMKKYRLSWWTTGPACAKYFRHKNFLDQ